MELLCQRSSVHYNIIGTIETDYHYKFELQDPNKLTHILNRRIYKCSYFDPAISGMDTMTNETTIGKINYKQQTFEIIKEFIETEVYYPYKHKFLSFFGEETATNIYFHLYYLFISHVDYGKMPIEINRLDYNFDKNTSLLKNSHTHIRKVAGLNETQIIQYIRKKEIEKNPCSGNKYK